ncbi:MAG: dipeptidase PepV, partial [bacterium]|nr:dipeptidase PepV [bacterium]
LMESYAEVTGDTESKPMAIGGGTYAKVLEEGVAFGSMFPGEEELAHQAGEYISLDSLVNNLYIFVKAIQKLQD